MPRLLTRIIFAIWYLPVFFVLTIVAGFVCLLGSLFSKKFARFVSDEIWGTIVLGPAFIKLKIRGRENIPKGPGGFIVFSNHRSMLDIPAVSIAIERPLSWVAKASLGKIPVFGWVLKRVHMLVEREGGSESARKMIEEATSRLKAGEAMAIFPEGTRNRTTDKDLLPFKKGAFIMAKHTNVPLIPVCVYNSGNLWPAGEFLPRRGTITVSIGAPLSLNDNESLGSISKRASEAMEILYKDLDRSAKEKNEILEIENSKEPNNSSETIKVDSEPKPEPEPIRFEEEEKSQN
jgi:1-acyl-sn-glycerol-3-phosphate acyltransferase